MFKVFTKLSAVALITSSFNSVAIVNIEDMRKDDDATTQAEININFSGAQGNTDSQKRSIANRYQWNDFSTQFIVFKYDYEKNKNLKSADKTFFHYRYIHDRSKSSNWEAFFQVQNDAFKLLKLRTLLGAGYRQNLLLDSEQHHVKVGYGLFHAYEEQNNTDNTVVELTRFNFYVAYQYNINKTVSFNSTSYYQPAVDETSDFQALEQLSFEFKLSKDFMYFLSLDISYDSQPLNGLEKQDTAYTSGISYRF